MGRFLRRFRQFATHQPYLDGMLMSPTFFAVHDSCHLRQQQVQLIFLCFSNDLVDEPLNRVHIPRRELSLQIWACGFLTSIVDSWTPSSEPSGQPVSFGPNTAKRFGRLSGPGCVPRHASCPRKVIENPEVLPGGDLPQRGVH